LNSPFLLTWLNPIKSTLVFPVFHAGAICDVTTFYQKLDTLRNQGK